MQTSKGTNFMRNVKSKARFGWDEEDPVLTRENARKHHEQSIREARAAKRSFALTTEEDTL